MVLDFFDGNDGDMYEEVFRKIENETNTFRNSFDEKKLWNEAQKQRYEELISKAKEGLSYFLNYGSYEGQAPFRYLLLIIYGKFDNDLLARSQAAWATDMNIDKYLELFKEIRKNLDELMNKSPSRSK